MDGNKPECEGAIVNTGILIKGGAVTVAGKTSADIPPGTLASILKQAGLK